MDESLPKSCPMEDFDISGFEPLGFPPRKRGRIIHLVTYKIIVNLFSCNSPLNISGQGKIKSGVIAIVILKRNDFN